MQIVVTKKTNYQYHIWLNALNHKISTEQTVQLLQTTDVLKDLDDKSNSKSVWEIVATLNLQTIQQLRRDSKMNSALAEIFKPEIEAASSKAFDNGFNGGINEKGMQIFRNMINRGYSREEAQTLADISDELVDKALKNNN